MFDTYHSRRETHEHNHRTTIEEKRAPTDASVRLLREMEQAAQDKLMGSVRLAGCEVDCVVHSMRSMLSDEYSFAIQYRLGAQRHKVTHNFLRGLGEDDEAAKERVALELVRALGEDIARNVLGPAVRQMVKRQGGGLL